MASNLKKRKFFDFFPTPRILRMPAIGVDISDESIKFIELKRTSRGIELGEYGKYDIPQGVIEGGEVKSLEEFSKTLGKFREQYGFDVAHASLPEQHAYIFQTRIPKEVRRRDIRDIIEFKLEENVPLSGKEAVFDFSFLEEGEDEVFMQEIDEENKKATSSEKTLDDFLNEPKVSENDTEEIGEEEVVNIDNSNINDKDNTRAVTVFVYKRNIVEQYTQAFENAGIVPLSFEIETQASAYSVIPKGDKGTYMVVDFGRSQAGLSIVSREVLGFTSTLDVGGDDLNRAIIKTFSVSEEEAEDMKNKRGFINSEENKDLFAALVSTMTAFKDELNKHYIYWNTHDSGAGKRHPIEKIILCGGNANLPGLPEYLTASMGVSTVRADVWVNVRSNRNAVPSIDFRHSLEYATTIGLALRSLDI